MSKKEREICKFEMKSNSFWLRDMSRTQCSGQGLLCTGDRGVSTTAWKSTVQVDSTAFNLIYNSSEYYTHAVKTKRGNYKIKKGED